MASPYFQSWPHSTTAYQIGKIGLSDIHLRWPPPAPELEVELRDATRKLIAETEQATGFPVAVMEDASLHVMSTVQMAAPNRPGHVVRIHPKAPAGVDYYATYYCRMIQRFFENPPEERFVFGAGEQGRNQIRKLLANSALGNMVSKDQIPGICEQLLHGLMIDLRSIPIGLRVDNWIFGEHPDLVEMQKNAAQRQLKENLGSTSDTVRASIPPQIYDATMTINAAYAQFWAEKWNEPELMLSYKASGHAAAGERLLKILHDTPDSGRTDRALIDAWGAALNVTGWYVWLTYKGPQQ
jgi:hypothetical protein